MKCDTQSRSATTSAKTETSALCSSNPPVLQARPSPGGGGGGGGLDLGCVLKFWKGIYTVKLKFGTLLDEVLRLKN